MTKATIRDMKKMQLLSFFLIYLSVTLKRQDNLSSTNLPSTNTKTTHIEAFTPRELSIGDKVPDIQINSVINHKSSNVKLSDFKGKLLIIDFWATWCGPCIASFPKLESLQKTYSNELQILPVTHERISIVRDFLSRLYQGKTTSLPSVTDDKLLSKLFKHNYLPHYIWINKDLKIVAITEGKDVTEQNIKNVLQGKDLNVRIKKDRINIVNTSVPTMQPVFHPAVEIKSDTGKELKKLDNPPIFHSILTNSMDGLASGIKQDSTLYSAWNVSILRLYQLAFAGYLKTNFIQFNPIIDITDSLLHKRITAEIEPRLSGLEFLEWRRTNPGYYFCYEIKIPTYLSKDKYKIMINDLNTLFGAMYGIEGVTKDTMTKYLSLEIISDSSRFISLGKEPKIEQDKLRLSISNKEVAALITSLSIPLQSYPPIINETNYTGNIDIELKIQNHDLLSINNQLKEYGLRLQEKTKMTRTAIIRSIKKS